VAIAHRSLNPAAQTTTARKERKIDATEVTIIKWAGGDRHHPRADYRQSLCPARLCPKPLRCRHPERAGDGPETNFDGIRNVGIKDGLIATITEDDIAGNETIDATNHVVAPGFIDTHFHWTRPIGYKVALRDGVTTAMDLEAGVFGPRVDEWYQMHEGESQVNYGTASGHEFARSKVTQNVPMQSC
jgi:hypothetical protein